MNKLVKPLLLTVSLLAINNVYAADTPLSAFEGVSQDTSEDSADPDDPCATVMCLYGKLTGDSQSQCDPIIKSFKKIGIKNPKKMIKKRTKFINSCPTADSAIRKMVLKAYGKIK